MPRDIRLAGRRLLVTGAFAVWLFCHPSLVLLLVPLLLLASAVLLVYPARVGIAMPVLVWLGSEWVVWGLGFVVLDEVFHAFPLADLHLRADLLCLHFLGAIAGLVLGIRLYSSGPLTQRSHKDELAALRRLYLFTLGVTLAYLSVFLIAGGLVARRDIGNFVTSDQSFYWLRGLESVPYAFFFVAGRLIAVEQKRAWRWFAGFAPLLIATLYLLTGGRGVALLLLLIATFSYILMRGSFSLRQAVRVMLVAFACAAVVIFVGAVRDNPHFENASGVLDRFSAVLKVLDSELIGGGDTLRNGLLRIVEPQAQVVIEDVAYSEVWDGFEHFGRLRGLWLPAFVLGDTKEPLDDGPDVLRDRFGFTDINEFKSIPITLIADEFRRGGGFGVFMGAAFVALMLVALMKAIMRWIQEPLARDFGRVLLTIMALKLYPMSLLGVIGYLLYTMPRNLLINLLLLYLARRPFVQKARRSSANLQADRHPERDRN